MRTSLSSTDVLFLLDAAGSEPLQALIGGQHTERYVMVKNRQVRHDLLAEGETAGKAEEFGLREEAIIEAHAAADAVAGFGEAEAGDDDEVDQIGGHRVA